MNILFLTQTRIELIGSRNIYTDLIQKIAEEGHCIHVVSPIERRLNKKTNVIESGRIKLLQVKTLNLLMTNFFEKGIGTLLMGDQYLRAINQYFSKVKFDLILYSTPPITLSKTVKKIKGRDNAKTYLLLKDIFPQNAVDLEIIKKNSFVYKFFRKKEQEIYELSDYIGCMSPANVEYVLKHNPSIEKKNVEICPNSFKVAEKVYSQEGSDKIKKKYGVPLHKNTTVFMYGGNLGQPQGLDFLLDVLRSNKEKKDRFFLIVGAGTEYRKIKDFFDTENISNALLLSVLPKEEYSSLIATSDVGLIFLDKRFTIPNYPSRLLDYLENSIPILAATDINTDIGKIAEDNKYGFWCENGNLEKFNLLIEKFVGQEYLIREMGNNGYEFLKKNYTVDNTYNIIFARMKNV